MKRRVSAVEGRPLSRSLGGLDSSSVLSCAVEFTGAPQQAYSSVYADKT